MCNCKGLAGAKLCEMGTREKYLPVKKERLPYLGIKRYIGVALAKKRLKDVQEGKKYSEIISKKMRKKYSQIFAA